MKVHHEVTALHPERKTVSVKNLTTGEVFEESYDKLILSPGAKPTQPKLPGIDMAKSIHSSHCRRYFSFQKNILKQKSPRQLYWPAAALSDLNWLKI